MFLALLNSVMDRPWNSWNKEGYDPEVGNFGFGIPVIQ